MIDTPETNIVEVNRLWQDDDKWEYSKRAECIIGEYLRRRLGTKLIHLTENYAPEYDMLMSIGKIESKITQGSHILIEFAREDGRDSGIALSTADYYLITHRGVGMWDGQMRDVGKVRLIPTESLWQVITKTAQRLGDKALVINPASADGPGSKCVKLSATKQHNDFTLSGVDDGWVGDIEFIRLENGTCAYNFGNEGNKNWRLLK